MQKTYRSFGKILLLLSVFALYGINTGLKAQTIPVTQGDSICFEDGNYEITGTVKNVTNIYSELIIGDGTITTTLLADGFFILYEPVIADTGKTLQIYIRFDGLPLCPSKELLFEFFIAGDCNIETPCPEFVEDIEGNTYKVTSLAGYCWTENLKSTIYNCSLDSIPFAKAYTCSSCPDNLDEIFGLLYDWYSAMGVGALHATPLQEPNCICPEGFHLPTRLEWSALARYDASQLKSTEFWIKPPGPGTDDFGWDARPAGWYNGSVSRFENLYGYAGWWTSDAPSGDASAYIYFLAYFCDQIQQEMKRKGDGLSVRCVMDY